MHKSFRGAQKNLPWFSRADIIVPNIEEPQLRRSDEGRILVDRSLIDLWSISLRSFPVDRIPVDQSSPNLACSKPIEADAYLPLVGWIGRNFTPYGGRQANGFSARKRASRFGFAGLAGKSKDSDRRVR
jgi:hypothetical protein